MLSETTVQTGEKHVGKNCKAQIKTGACNPVRSLEFQPSNMVLMISN